MKRTLKDVVGEERRWQVGLIYSGRVVVAAEDDVSADARARALSPAALLDLGILDRMAVDRIGQTDESSDEPRADAWWALHVRAAEWLQSAAKMALHALRRGATDRDRADARAALRLALRQARYTEKDERSHRVP